MQRRIMALGALTFALGLGLEAHAQVTAEQLAATEIRAEKIGDGLHVLFGLGGNILASIGTQGVLLVDTQFPPLVPKYKKTLEDLGGGKISVAINTHWHYDHSEGNQVLGPDGVWLVAQSNSRAKLMQNNMINTVVRPPFEQPAYPAAALVDAAFGRAMQLTFNGEKIDLLHFGPAHTTGDAAVIFRTHNVVHMGDVFNNSGYPFIDTDNGGDLDGTIAFCEAVLKELNAESIVVPGHGPVAKQPDLVAYVAMLKGVRTKLAALIAQGMTLEQVVAAKPTAEWDARYGDPTRMVNRGYAALTRNRR
jgi:glyoxylase-like metal-dependent hydrolase (beta-lactamase superfamily II)